jgi:hypothetical protein
MRNIGFTLFVSLISVSSFFSFAQHTVLPGDKSIDVSFLKSGLNTMAYKIVQNGQTIDIGTYEIENVLDKGILTSYSKLYIKNYAKPWTDICAVEANTLKPLSFSSDRDKRYYSLVFSDPINGELTNFVSGKKESISLSIKSDYFSSHFSPQLIKTLPLKLGYKATIPVYDYEAPDKSKIYNNTINEVKTDIYTSTLTGKHEVWRVNVSEESTGDIYDYHIDKKTRRLWMINLLTAKGQHIVLYDKESDYNPVKQKFDKEKTLASITKGNATVTGEVFGRADKNADNWMAVVNRNPKQMAAKGTTVYLIPYSAWYKEYFALNKDLKKVGRKFNMPKEALECILVSYVYDDQGHFEFANLMPGEYLIYSLFGFNENYAQTSFVGTRDLYVGNIYQGSSDITQTNRWSGNMSAFAEEIIKIETDGEAIEIKLKKQEKSKVF